MSRHTPGPWEHTRIMRAGSSWIVRPRGKAAELAYVPHHGAFSEANAAFIVRAANCHYDLLAALERMDRAYTSDAEQAPDVSMRASYETNSDVHAQARASIAKARS